MLPPTCNRPAAFNVLNTFTADGNHIRSPLYHDTAGSILGLAFYGVASKVINNVSHHYLRKCIEGFDAKLQTNVKASNNSDPHASLTNRRDLDLR